MGHGPPPPPQSRAAAQAERAERRAKALRLSSMGWTLARIAREGGLGYNSPQAVHVDIKAALKVAQAQLAAEVEVWRARELAVIDEALEAAHRILHNRHLATSVGKVVQRATGQLDADGQMIYEDVYDEALNLAAAEKIVKFSESRRKLIGTDAPAKQEISGSTTVQYQVSLDAQEMEQL